MYPSAADLRAKWSAPDERAAIIAAWKNAAFRSRNWRRPPNSPMLIHSTCCAMSPIVRPSAAGGSGQRRRGMTARPSLTDSPTGRGRCSNELLEKYVEFGTAQFQIPGHPESAAPDREHGNVIEIAGLFGGPEQLRAAVGRTSTIALRSIRDIHGKNRSTQERSSEIHCAAAGQHRQSPAATSCARTRGSTATSTACRCSPGSCS